MTWINIPDDWTGAQALAVVEILDEISAAVWSLHEIRMLEVWHRRYAEKTEKNPEEIPPDHSRDTSTNTHNIENDFPF